MEHRVQHSCNLFSKTLCDVMISKEIFLFARIIQVTILNTTPHLSCLTDYIFVSIFFEKEFYFREILVEPNQFYFNIELKCEFAYHIIYLVGETWARKYIDDIKYISVLRLEHFSP